MKKVLVTGADGFIGSHLVELLCSQGFQVRALVQYNSFNSWGWLDASPVKKNIEIVAGDIRDPGFCDTLVSDVNIIFHLAALVAIPYSYAAPMSYVQTNIIGTVNICQAALKYGVEKLVHTSTSEVYGTAIEVPISETHPLQPQSPYSASKIGADAMAMSYFNAYGLPVVIARPFNTYGPRQSARAVIPTIITQIASGKEEIELGDITPTRDFNYVLDTCRGFVSLIAPSVDSGQVLNIGSNDEISIKDLFYLIKKLMHSNVLLKTTEDRLRPKTSEVYRLRCDNSKLNKLTGYQPTVTLEEGLKLTIEWFSVKNNLEAYKAEVYNV